MGGTPLTDQEYLLKTILDEPSNNDARLVYADWCEETGDAQRAEFIRIQCELPNSLCSSHDDTRRPDCHCKHCTLYRREKELLASSNNYMWFCPHIKFKEMVTWTFRRGFVASVSCHLADWCGDIVWCDFCHPDDGGQPWFPVDGGCPRCGSKYAPARGPELVRMHPIEGVRLLNRAPLAIEQHWFWYLSVVGWRKVHSLPEDVYRRLTGGDHGVGGSVIMRYSSLHDAIHAASQALIQWAKEQM